MAVCQTYAFMIVILSLDARVFLTLDPNCVFVIWICFFFLQRNPFQAKEGRESPTFLL